MFPDVAQPQMALPTIIMTTLRIMGHRLPQMFAICPHRGWTIMLHPAGQWLSLKVDDWLATWENMHLQSMHNCFRYSGYVRWWVIPWRWLLLRWRRVSKWHWAQRRASRTWNWEGISMFSLKETNKRICKCSWAVSWRRRSDKSWNLDLNAKVDRRIHHNLRDTNPRFWASDSLLFGLSQPPLDDFSFATFFSFLKLFVVSREGIWVQVSGSKVWG